MSTKQQPHKHVFRAVFLSAALAASAAVTLLLLARYEIIRPTKSNIKMKLEDETYEEVYYGNIFCRLPAKKYRIWIQRYDQKREYGAFGFSAILPNIAPATSDLSEANSWGKGTGWHKQIPILVEFGFNYISQEKQIDNHFEDSNSMKELQERQKRNGMKVKKFKYIDKNRFTLLKNGCKRYDGYALAGNVIQICSVDGRPISVACDVRLDRESKTSPYCHAAFNVLDRMRVSYSYGYNYFDDWLALHEKVVILLRSFCHPIRT